MHLSPGFGQLRPLHHYSLHATLGAGNFAKVKLATHLPTGQPVAIKILSHHDVSRVYTEVQVMQSLDHPHVVQLYEVETRQVVEGHKKTFLVMEYLDGGDLLKYVAAQQRLQEPEARRLFRQLMSGLEYLHSLGVSHRDLKPANLLLNARKDLKIADFGLSAAGSMDTLETRCGSPCFTAPEVIGGLPYDGRKVDIWGLGIVLYIMLVGRLPFEDDNKAGLFRKICAGKYSLPVHVSVSARDLLKRTLTVEARDRATVAEIQKHAWLAGIEPAKSLSRKAKCAIDYSVFAETQALGFTYKELLEGLERKVKNAATATYHILRNKHSQEDTVELLNLNRTLHKRSASPLLVRRRNASIRPSPEPSLRSPKSLDRKPTLFTRKTPSLRPLSQCRGRLPDTKRPTATLLRRRIYA